MKKIAILGFGKSGQSAYSVLNNGDYDIYVFDENLKDENKEHFFFGKSSDSFYEFEFDEIIASPGIPKSHPFIRFSLENKTPIISELELGYRLSKCPIIAITGTNGKTTTVALIEKIMKANGKNVVACGNYGYPITLAAAESGQLDYLITEVSSYQLEFIDKFKPFISAILNIGFDHIKWHASLENYKQAKLRIFKNQDENDFFIKNDADDYIYNAKANLLTFSKNDREADCFLNKDKIVVNYKSRDIIKKLNLFGNGNFENAAVSSLVSRVCNLDNRRSLEVIESMENLEHRLEFVGEIDDVKFYNDSKSTNIDSVVNALNSFDSDNIVLILGGKHKGEPFSKILELLQKKTRAVIVYGDDKHIIMKELSKLIPIPLPALNVRGALVGAFEVAQRGDIVLFSPGGSSCEPYKNFEERGKAFKKEFAEYKDYYENTPGV